MEQPTAEAVGAHRAVDGRHVAGVGVDVHRVHRNLGLWNQLLVVVGFQVPDVNGTALIAHNQLGLQENSNLWEIPPKRAAPEHVPAAPAGALLWW